MFCEWVFYSEERFIKFVNPKDFKDVDWKVFEHTLVQIVADEATEVVVEAAMLTIHPLKMNHALSTYNLFTNIYIKQELVNKYKTDEQQNQNELLRNSEIHSLLWVCVYNEIKFDLWYQHHDRK